MQPDLPERAAQRVQRRLDLADRLVVPGLHSAQRLDGTLRLDGAQG